MPYIRRMDPCPYAYYATYTVHMLGEVQRATMQVVIRTRTKWAYVQCEVWARNSKVLLQMRVVGQSTYKILNDVHS